jgi:fucose permease
MSRLTAWPQSVRLYLVSFLLVGLSLSVLGPALTELRERSGADIGDIGVLFAGQSTGYIIGSFTGGRLYDRLDGHRVFAASLVLLGIGLGMVPVFDDLTGLFLTFVVVGVGASVADLGANTMLMWELGAGSGRAMNTLHLFFGIGALAAPLVVYVGLDVATRSAAFACIVLAMWASRVAAPSRPAKAREEHTDTTLPMLLLLFLFFFLYVGLEIGYAGWITTYGEEIGFSDLAATWLTTTFWIGFTSGRLLASVLAHRVRPDMMLYAASAASVTAAVILIAGGGSTAPVWIGTALMGLATAPQFPGMMNLAERRIHISGSATSWFVGGAGAGGLVFPFVIGSWFDSRGATALPWAALALALATFAAFVGSSRALGHVVPTRVRRLVGSARPGADG